MYKSPIDIFTTDIHTQIVKQQDEEIYQAVLRVGVNVDKEELIRALRYDRQQYNIGYMEGEAAAKASIVRCKDCDSFCPCGNDSYICSSWGSWADPDGWCYKGERREGE